jgi:hypothetical protein
VATTPVAIAQPFQEETLGFGGLAGYAACKLHGSALNDPVTGGGLFDPQGLPLHSSPKATPPLSTQERNLAENAS